MSSPSTQLLAESRSAEAIGDIAVALRRAASALEQARASGDRDLISCALCLEATIHWRIGHFARAYALSTEAVTNACATITQVDALILAGACAAACDDLAVGEDSFQQAIDLSREIGYPAGHSLALQYLASQVYLRRGQFELALTTADTAAQLGSDDRQPPTWLLRAWVYQIIGAQERAWQALEVLRGLAPPDARIGAAASYLAAQLALDEGDLKRARPLLDKALLVAEASGHPLLYVEVGIALSRWHRLNNDGAALEWAANAVATARRLGSRYLEGQALIARGQAAWQAGELDSAVGDLQCTLVILDELGAAYDAAHAGLLLSALYQQLHHAEAEAVWLDAARRITAGRYGFLLERERPLALALLKAQCHRDQPEVRAATDRLLDELMRVPPPPLQISGLGDFVVRQGHRCIPAHAWEQRKAGELFRFLLIQPHYRACRDVIIEALWPGKQHSAAERFLQQASWALRHVLEPDLPEHFPSRYLSAADHHFSIQLPTGSTVDFVQFEKAIYRKCITPSRELERILASYHGELFPDDRYADWSIQPRQRLTNLYVRSMLCMAKQYLEDQSPVSALDYCDHILMLDPCLEEAGRIAILSCLALGDRPGALRYYTSLKRVLRRTLRLSPSEDLRALASTIS